jgi:transposase
MTLEEENAALRRENAELREQLAKALARIAALEKPPREPPSFAKRNTPKPKRKTTRKPRAAEDNAARRRQDPTHILEHSLERCPDCRALLSARSLDRRRQVIDLPPPIPIQVTEHQVFKGWCGRCRRWHTPTLDLRSEVVGQARFGIRLMSLVSYLATTLRVPHRQIQQYLAVLHQLPVSVGAISSMLSTVHERAKPHILALKTTLRRSQVVHADETGWREDGQNGYIWSFSTPGPQAIRYYEYHKSRSGKVARRILSGRFRGHLVSDFYSGYNWYAGPHQRCWAHLLRDMHALSEAWEGDEVVEGWVGELRQLYDEAGAFKRLGARASPAQRKAAYEGWVEEVRQLGLRYADAHHHPCQVLGKRLLRHQDELFQFVLVDEVAADNSQAERSVRPLVIARKVSGGSRSGKGSATRMGLFSLFGTWAARGDDPLEACRQMLMPQIPLPQL